MEHLLAAAAERRPLPSGGIILAATPLGDPLDASIRLIDALGSADVIAAEDTRRTRYLAEALGVEIRGKIVSNFDHNESERAGQLVDAARNGQRVLVVTDAGMPSVSDPGFPLVQAAYEAGIPVTCLPGPSAVPTSLALSGLAVGHFTFMGFAPRKEGARRKFFSSLVDATMATCFFDSPHRIADTLEIAADVLGEDRPAAVCRELTKRYEEVKRGGLGELAQWAGEGLKGEISVVIGGISEKQAVPSVGSLVDEVQGRVAAGERLKAVCGEIAERAGVSKRALYEAVLEARS
ncbi:16S rRNA (cytidine(1402)-2'-O)-methyltransferase [Corynebacterium anserum]|uniref:Ribosomal RNA small subunit methyltransferase I n=1 Tax=Corynebacterium anserum TaxID=2684406 RepID=A0A7G7YPH8_9CORY|nr:16S rRNA (cytidine(1402)-2'-O)-methyltransferase [Corynebacterium anserum]MBC2682026.1 16S rRNA (cytidine(1402)-2'-O)-methyltransferase [Corynebacterium anserum]QNH96398.1 16S rRNA (cytidine(1402)-2'-O)-methyltransferase [Corynebacterium anserum]